MTEIANKGRVRVWEVEVHAACGGPEYLCNDRRHAKRQWIEVAALPDLKNLLTELADVWDKRADRIYPGPRGLTLAAEIRNCTRELRHLITEQLGSEGENE
jgi:hypothetical protein